MAHTVVAKIRGYKLNEIVLMPYGAVAYGGEQIERKSSLIIAIAGPLMNGFLAIFCLALWWVFPITMKFTMPFFYANLVIGVFNLIPAFPLDGSRMVLALTKNKLKALKGLKIFGVIVSFALLGMFIASAFFDINFSFGILAIFLFVGAVSGTKNELYFHVADHRYKDYGEGVENREINICYDSPLRRVLHFIKPKYCTDFVLVNNTGKVYKKISEKQMEKILIEQNLNDSILKAVKKSLSK